MSRMVATLCYIGLLRPAPGTWASLAALPLAWAIHALGGAPGLGAALVAAVAAGWWAITAEEAAGSPHDTPEIVIDELAGQWLALMPVSIGAGLVDADVLALWPGIVTAFVAFRLFDVWKPGPVGWADRQPGPIGVIVDDLLAGLMAAGVVVALAAAAHLPVLL